MDLGPVVALVPPYAAESVPASGDEPLLTWLHCFPTANHVAQWLPFLALAGIGYLGMGGYNAFLQRNVIQKALDRVDQVRSFYLALHCQSTTLRMDNAPPVFVGLGYGVLQCVADPNPKCDRWSLFNMKVEFPPLSNTVIAFQFLTGLLTVRVIPHHVVCELLCVWVIHAPEHAVTSVFLGVGTCVHVRVVGDGGGGVAAVQVAWCSAPAFGVSSLAAICCLSRLQDDRQLQGVASR